VSGFRMSIRESEIRVKEEKFEYVVST